MDSDGSEASGSFIVHSENSGSVVVHDVPDDSGLSAPRVGGGSGGANASHEHGSTLDAILRKRPLAAAATPVAGFGSSTMLDSDAAGDETVRVPAAGGRRLPRPKPVLRWSQVPQESRGSPASYLMNRYGRGGGGAGGLGASGGGPPAGPAHHGGVNLGDSLDAFKLYVGDDGEMKMGDHHDDFYSFTYDPVDDADDLVNLQHRQLSANNGGDFYEDTDDSAFNSSDDGFGTGGEVALDGSDDDGIVTDRRSWKGGVGGASMMNRTVSRRRRLPPRRGTGRKPPPARSSGKAAAQRRPRGRSSLSAQQSGGHPQRSATAPSGDRGASTTRRLTSAAAVGPSPGAHVAAGAAAYPHLPASLGALVLLSPGVPTTTPLDKVQRVRQRLLQRQSEEQREYERRQRTRQQHKKSNDSTAAGAEAEMALSPRTLLSPRRGSGTAAQADGAAPRAGHPVGDLKLAFEDLSRSMGPGTARMGAGASLAILRSARYRGRESPRLQEVALRKEVVYVRADPAERAGKEAAPQRTDAATQVRDGSATEGAKAAEGSGAPPYELRDPYTGEVIPYVFDSATAQAVPRASVSRTAGITFFHDPTAPRPIAIADVVPLPLLLSQRGASEATSSREASLQTSFSASPVPAATYVLPSSFQHPATTAADAGLRPPTQRQNTAFTASSLSGSPRLPLPAAAAAGAAGGGAAPLSSPDLITAATRHARTDTVTYRDMRLALTPRDGRRDSHADPRLPLFSAQDRLGDYRVPAALVVGEYRMPTAIATGGGGGGGQRQRWRLQGGPQAGAVDGESGGAPLASTAPPPWRWMHGPPPPAVKPLSINSAGSSGSRGGRRALWGRENSEGHSLIPANVAHHSGGLDGTAAEPPTDFYVRGFQKACEANWAAQRGVAATAPGGGSAAAMQLPLYPSSVAPYAAPRNPLEQNIRYHAWTADGVSASTGAACVVHVFTVTREMLRSVYEYVAYNCALRREREVQGRERARQRRMKEALMAGVLTRDLLRCLRCPHCGTVGQIVKAAGARHLNQSIAARPPPHQPTPPQLSQSMNAARGMAASLHGHPSLRPSASATNFPVDPPKQQQQQPQQHTENASRTERVRPPLPQLPATPYPGAATAHPSLAPAAETSAHDTVVTELTAAGGLREAEAAATTTAVEQTGLSESRRARPTLAEKAVRRDAAELEASASVTTTSPLMQTALLASTGALPPLPPSSSSHTLHQARLLSPTQSAAAVDVPGGSTQLLSPHANVLASTSRFVPLGSPNPATALVGSPTKQAPASSSAVAALGTTEEAELAGEPQHSNRSGESRELSHSFAAPSLLLTRSGNAALEFPRYATGTNASSGGGHAPAYMRLSDSHPNLSASNLHRSTPEKEESSVRMGSRVLDEATAAPATRVRDSTSTPTKSTAVVESAAAVAGRDGEGDPPTPSAFEPLAHSPQTPPRSLLEGFMTPPTLSMLPQTSTSPHTVERTLYTGGAQPRSLLSPTSMTSLPMAANTLPPLPLTAPGASSSTPNQAPLLTAVSPPAARPPAGHRASVNNSFSAVLQPPRLTPAAPSLTANGTPQLADVAASAARDPFGESGTAAANRSSAALARDYVCQCCHSSVVPKTSMVALPSLDDRVPSQPQPRHLSEGAVPAAAAGRATSAAGAELLAFEDLLLDDALVHALQTHLQEALMLPPVCGAQPLRTHVAAPVPPPPNLSNDSCCFGGAGEKRQTASGSTYVDTEASSKARLRSPLAPSLHRTPAGDGAADFAAAAVDAAHVRLPDAFGHGGESALWAARDRADTFVSAAEGGGPHERGAAVQPPMPAFSRLSLRSSSVSSMSSSEVEERPKDMHAGNGGVVGGGGGAGGGGGKTSPLESAQFRAPPTAPQLLRLTAPCCGLKVSVLEFVPPVVAASPTAADAEDQQSPDGAGATATAAVRDGLMSSDRQPRRRSTGSGLRGARSRQLPRRASCPPAPTIPRMREDAATRGLTQSALFMTKTNAAPAAQGRAGQAALARRSQSRRAGKVSGAGVSRGTPLSLTVSNPDLGGSLKTMMQDTDASKRHRVQVNARVRLDATSINRIWERVFTRDKSTAVAAVAAERDKARAKRLKAAVESATRGAVEKGREGDAGGHGAAAATDAPHSASQSPRKGPSPTQADGVTSREHETLGVDLAKYTETSLVLKVELAYPRLPRGNVRQLLEEWVRTYQPHTVLIEAVIRNIIYGVLVQLQTLHAAGYTSGSVKSTNVYPMWDLVKAMREAGLRMPPRPRTPSFSASAPERADSVAISGDGAAKAGDGGGRSREHSHHLFEVPAGAGAREGSALRAAEPARRSRSEETVPVGSVHWMDESAQRPAGGKPLAAFPAAVAKTMSRVESTASMSVTAVKSPGEVSMPAVHATASLATPLMPRQADAETEADPPHGARKGGDGVYRRTSTKAPAMAGTKPGHAGRRSLEQSASATTPEQRRRPSSAATAQSAWQRASAQLAAAEAEEKAAHSLEALSMSGRNALRLDTSGSGSGAFPFSPDSGLPGQAAHRPRRGFSIDDSVVVAGPERRRRSSLSEVGRRTHSAGAVSHRRRRSTETRSWELEQQEEELVPLIVEVVAPPSLKSSQATSASNPTTGRRDTYGVPSPRGTASASEQTTTGVPSRQNLARRGGGRLLSSANSFKLTAGGNATAAATVGADERVSYHFVRGAQLLPPAQVALPALRIPAEAARLDHHLQQEEGEEEMMVIKTARAKAFSLATVTEDEDDRAETSAQTQRSARVGGAATAEAHTLLTRAPPGAVPRPLSRSYKDVGRSRSKSDGGSGGGGGRDSPAGDDATDPLQWSQQVMLADSLGERVETALRLAMAMVLTQHPPCPARTRDGDDATQGAASHHKKRGKAPAAANAAANAAASAGAAGDAATPRRTSPHHMGGEALQGTGESRGASPRDRAAKASPRSRTPRPAAAAAVSAERPVNAYTPDLSKASPPSRPVLFGLQEAEYIPAPETIRSIRDEATALWRLWRQQQPQAPAADGSASGQGDPSDDAKDAWEAAQMAYVIAQLAEQGCPTTTLRNTLDPYSFSTAATDIWQLGMMALDLADGPVPTTWLKQREPTPRLCHYPWSSYFQAFVSRCLQCEPDERGSADELLLDPWFSVALVPQVTSANDGATRATGVLQQRQGIPVLPPPALPCVMGVDCLTSEEAKEWEAFDYTTLYAAGGPVHSLDGASPPPQAVTPAAGDKAAGLGRPRRSSSVPAGAGVDGAGSSLAVAAPGASVAGLVGSSAADLAGVSQSFGHGGLSSTAGAMTARTGGGGVGGAAVGLSSTVNSSGGAGPLASTLDADVATVSSVDLAQYFTRLAAVQWRRQQQQALAASLVSPIGVGRSPHGVAAAAAVSLADTTLSAAPEEAWALLRQSVGGARHLQALSPRHTLFSLVSPRTLSASALVGSSQGLQTDLLGTGGGQGGRQLMLSLTSLNSASAAAYGLPSALNAAGAAAALSPRGVQASSGRRQTPTPPPQSPSPRLQGSLLCRGLPSAYVPLRDPCVVGGGGAAVAAAHASSASSASPRWVGGSGEGLPASQRAHSPFPFMTALHGGRGRVVGGGDGAEKADSRWEESDSHADPLHDAGTDTTSSSEVTDWDGEDTCSSGMGDDSDGDYCGGEDGGVSAEGRSTHDSADSWVYRSSAWPTAHNHNHNSSSSSSSSSSASSRNPSFFSSLDDGGASPPLGGEVACRPGSKPLRERTEGRAPTVPHPYHGPLDGSFDGKNPSPRLPTALSHGHTGAAGYERRRPAARRTTAHVADADHASGKEEEEEMPRSLQQLRQRRRRRHHLLLGTIATSLARLSTLVESSSDSEDADSSSSSDSEYSDCSPRYVFHSRRQTQNYDEAASPDSTCLHPPLQIAGAAAAAHRDAALDAPRAQASPLAPPTSLFTPLSTLSPHLHVRGNAASQTFAVESDNDAHDEESDRESDDDEEDRRACVEEQCDEILRCFSVLQRGCPMAVSLWCARALQQAQLHPRTAALAGRLLSRVERDVAHRDAQQSLSWLSPKESTTLATTDDEVRGGKEVDGAALSAVEGGAGASAAVGEASVSPAPPPTPPPVVDTCPSSFHSYELAKWLYASHQSIFKCT